MKGFYGRYVCDTVDKTPSEMALESLDNYPGLIVKFTCYFNAIAINGQHQLQRFDRLSLIAALKIAARADRRGCNPMANSLLKQEFPVEIFPRIHLSPRRNVRMSKHPPRGDVVAGENVTAQLGNRFHLRLGKIWKPGGMAAIDDFYANRAGIGVIIPFPKPDTGMVGPFVLWHHLYHFAISTDQIVAGDTTFRATQPFQRAGASGIVFHAGIVEQQHIGCRSLTPPPLAKVHSRAHFTNTG